MMGMANPYIKVNSSRPYLPKISWISTYPRLELLQRCKSMSDFSPTYVEAQKPDMHRGICSSFDSLSFYTDIEIIFRTEQT